MKPMLCGFFLLFFCYLPNYANQLFDGRTQSTDQANVIADFLNDTELPSLKENDVSFTMTEENCHWELYKNGEFVKTRTCKYVLQNDSDDDVFFWFGVNSFSIYVYRRTPNFSIMDVLDCNARRSDPYSLFTTPFYTFYKIIHPQSYFSVYVHGPDDNYSDEAVMTMTNYVKLSDTFLTKDDCLTVNMLAYGYQYNYIVLDINLFYNFMKLSDR